MASSYFRAENIRLPWSLSSTSVRLAVEYICLLMVLVLLVPEGEENHESGLNFRALQFWTTLNLLCESRNSPALLVVLLFHLIKGLFSIAWEYFFIYVIALINGAHKPTHSKTLLQKLLPNQQRQQQLKNQSANHNFTFSPPRLIFPSFDFFSLRFVTTLGRTDGTLGHTTYGKREGPFSFVCGALRNDNNNLQKKIFQNSLPHSSQHNCARRLSNRNWLDRDGRGNLHLGFPHFSPVSREFFPEGGARSENNRKMSAEIKSTQTETKTKDGLGKFCVAPCVESDSDDEGLAKAAREVTEFLHWRKGT